MTITPTGGGSPVTIQLDAPILLTGTTYRYEIDPAAANLAKLVAGTVTEVAVRAEQVVDHARRRHHADGRRRRLDVHADAGRSERRELL